MKIYLSLRVDGTDYQNDPDFSVWMRFVIGANGGMRGVGYAGRERGEIVRNHILQSIEGVTVWAESEEEALESCQTDYPSCKFQVLGTMFPEVIVKDGAFD